VVSGLAGAGKTVFLRALEDVGFYCVDNLPSAFLETCDDGASLTRIGAKNIALGLDSRDPATPTTLLNIFDDLKKYAEVSVVFLYAAPEVLTRRFRETRRQHPLTLAHPDVTLQGAIALDQSLVQPIQDLADISLDTSRWHMQILRRYVYDHFTDPGQVLDPIVNLVSFGFKFGTPNDLDTLFDVRCFKNPYYEESLRSLTGLSQDIQDYIFADEGVGEFIDRVTQLIRFLYPRYSQEGRHYFALGIGCTGGKHRSVAIVEKLAEHLRAFLPRVLVDHRDIQRL
jgi:UPF0042 nucleotide-binding protein